MHNRLISYCYVGDKNVRHRKDSEGFSIWGVRVAENFNFSDSSWPFARCLFCATNIRKHHTWQLAAYRFYKRWSWLFRKAAACTPALRGDSRSVASLGLITQLFLSKCNCSRFASLKFPFTLILVGTIIALWQWLCNNQWEVLMGTHPLLCNTRHRAMIMPVNLLHTRLTHISPSY